MSKKKRSSHLLWNQASLLVPAVLLFLILAVILSLMWLQQRQQNAAKLRELTKAMDQQIAIRIGNWVSTREETINLLAKSWAKEYKNNPSKFKHDAENILNTYHGFQAINWIDSTWTITIVNPENTNRMALGKNLHKHPFPTVPKALNKAVMTHKIATTAPIHLLQGGSGFVSYIPVFSEKQRLLGFVNVVFRIDSLIQYCLNDSYINTHFNYAIYSDKFHPVYWKGNIPKNEIVASFYKASTPVRIIDQHWTVSLFPTEEFIEAEISPSNNRFFLFNILFSFAIAFLIWIFLLRNRRLKQSEEHFRTLFDSANTWIYILDFDGTILDVNQAFLLSLTLEKHSVLQKNFLDFLSQESRTLFKTIIHNIKENKRFQAELKFQISDGDIRYLDCFGSVVFDKNKKPQFIIIHAIDITQRKYYQYKLNESEEKYRALSEQSSTGVYLIQDGQLNYVNPKFAQIFGFHSPDVITFSYSISDFIVEDEREKVQQNIQQLLESRNAEMHFEVTGQKKDGSLVNLEAFGHRIIFNTRPAILGTFIDITERKKNLATIRKLSNAIEQSPMATLITDTHHIIEYVNPAFLRMTGYSIEELLRKSTREVKQNKLSDELFQSISETTRRGQVWQGEIKSSKKNGQKFWLHIVVSPLKDNKGEITHFLINMDDITERKQLEDELVQKQKMEAIGRLAGGIAHDFNNLLTVINGYSQLILHTMPEEDPLHQKIEQIFQAGEHAKNLTSQLLAFSRKQIRRPIPLNLTQVVHNFEKMLTRLIGEDVQIICDLEENLWAIESDKSQLEQIILNLAVNARQAMPAGGKIIIKTENFVPDDTMLKTYPEIQAGNYVRLSIEDTGIGMDEETQEHIFEPFFTTKSLGQGTGLGLATVYGIIKQNNGYIYLKSALNKGTKFCIYFPVVEEKIEKTQEQSVSEGNLLGNETIFLVEDDPAVRELTLRSLKYFGYKVITSSNSEEALKKFDQNNITVDLLISDVIMPGMSGKKLVDLLRKEKPDLKVLFMSGYSEDQISKQGVLDSEINFIQKPFAPKDLVKRLRQILDS